MTSLVSGEAGRGQLGAAVCTAGTGPVVGRPAPRTDLAIVTILYGHHIPDIVDTFSASNTAPWHTGQPGPAFTVSVL